MVCRLQAEQAVAAQVMLWQVIPQLSSLLPYQAIMAHRCVRAEEVPPLHWLPRAAAWLSHSHQLLALGGLELEDKQRLFPAYAQGSPYPSNALVLASLQRRQ